jgi:hypothetical protein
MSQPQYLGQDYKHGTEDNGSPLFEAQSIDQFLGIVKPGF